MPARYHARLVKRYADTAATHGRVAANLDLLNIGERFRNTVSPAADDGEIRDTAKRAANEAWRALAAAGSEADARSALLEVAGHYRIAPPPFDDFGKLVNRMTSPHWWRRKLRRQFQQAEAAFISMGFVHNRAALYLSDEAYARFESQQRNTDRLLSNLEAVNVETGETFKGGAVAYVAKYIAKNLDGKDVGLDLEDGGDAIHTAPRAVAWARLWGVRQFQPFGTPAVTIWRELRRLREITPAQDALFGTVWEAANEGRFADFLNLQADTVVSG